MITESESIRRMNQLNISPPLRKFSDGALLTFSKSDGGIYPSAPNSGINAYPSGGCLMWPNGEVKDGHFVPSAALDLASSAASKAEVFSQRKQREFTPDFKKNSEYWDRRRRNNEAAKRSREKRRLNDMFLENRVVKLMRENAFLKLQLAKICETYSLDMKEILAEHNQSSDKESDIHFDFPGLQDLQQTMHQGAQDARFSTANFLNLDQQSAPVTKGIEQLCVPEQGDPRRRHSCGSRPHTNQERPPKISIHVSDAEQVVDGILTPPKEDSSNLNCMGSLSPSLPHKLRHKPHLSDKDSPPPLISMPPSDQSGDELLTPPKVLQWHAPPDAKEVPAATKSDVDDDHKVSTFELKHENDQLRSELHQLASEVASLKDVLLSDSGRKRKKSIINAKHAPEQSSESLPPNE